MALFDFLRRNKQNKEKSIEEMSFEELNLKINSAKEEEEILLIDAKREIKINLDIFISELKNNLHILRSVKIEEKRELERIKLFVKENLYFYISHLERLLTVLQKIDYSSKTDDIALLIQNTFSQFIKNSNNYYGRAAVLVGKELEEIKISIRKLFDAIKPVIAKSDYASNRLKKIEKLIEMMNELSSTKKIQEDTHMSVRGFEDLIKDFEDRKKELEAKNEEFMQNPEFKEVSMKREELRSEAGELNQKIMQLKDKISLRRIARDFHDDKRKADLLNQYLENFAGALERDENLEINKIIKACSGIDVGDELSIIKHRIMKLREKNKEINKSIGGKSFEERIRESELKMRESDNNKEEEKKKIEKFSEKEKQLQLEIVESARTILKIQ